MNFMPTAEHRIVQNILGIRIPERYPAWVAALPMA